MAKNRVSLGIDAEDAIRQFDDLDDAVEDGASDAVRQLAVLAEGAMKSEAPEGDTGDLRDRIDTKFRRQGLTANVGSRKKVDGVLLATYVVEGTDPSSYDVNPGTAAFLAHQLMGWASAKLGDPQAAYPVAWSIIKTGHKRLPNQFVDRSLDDWEDQVENLTSEKVSDAMSRLMRGGS